MTTPHKYYLLNKPYGMESQFIANFPGALLGDLDYSFPEGIHAIGRLDKYSEGLLLLTTNKKITRLLFSSGIPHERTYYVQVKNKVSAERLEELKKGVSIRIRGGGYYITPATNAAYAEEPTDYPSPRVLSERQATTWLKIVLSEGKYHQVRKMVAAIHHPCLRLIRTSIESVELGKLQPGSVKEIEEADFFRLLKL